MIKNNVIRIELDRKIRASVCVFLVLPFAVAGLTPMTPAFAAEGIAREDGVYIPERAVSDLKPAASRPAPINILPIGYQTPEAALANFKRVSPARISLYRLGETGTKDLYNAFFSTLDRNGRLYENIMIRSFKSGKQTLWRVAQNRAHPAKPEDAFTAEAYLQLTAVYDSLSFEEVRLKSMKPRRPTVQTVKDKVRVYDLEFVVRGKAISGEGTITIRPGETRYAVKLVPPTKGFETIKRLSLIF